MSKLEEIAKRRAREIRADYGNPMRFDIACAIASMGITLIPYGFDSKINGLYIKKAGQRPCILVGLSTARMSRDIIYTAAHELGHHVIAEEVTFTDICYPDIPGAEETPLELACDTFADELLMPEPLVIRNTKNLTDNLRRSAELIADICGVSYYRARKRIVKLGIIALPNEDNY